jgi:hypothetical protein
VNFRAKLIRSSTLHQIWSTGHRIGGRVSGVAFRKIGQDFVSIDDPIPADAVSAFRAHHMIELEVSTAPAGDVTVAEGWDLDRDNRDKTEEYQRTEGNESQSTDPYTADSNDLHHNAKPEPVMRRRGRPPIQR